MRVHGISPSSILSDVAEKHAYRGCPMPPRPPIMPIILCIKAGFDMTCWATAAKRGSFIMAPIAAGLPRRPAMSGMPPPPKPGNPPPMLGSALSTSSSDPETVLSPTLVFEVQMAMASAALRLSGSRRSTSSHASRAALNLHD